jgi:Asp-tRNA(Asn)/Glu-tRNA(Gln) amidotransferase C subunit
MIEELLRTNSTILRDQVLNNILSVERTLVDNNSIIWKDELVDDIINSWRREDVQKIWLDRHKMSQNFPSGSLKYYMDKIETIKRSDYNPTVEDIFRCNGKTTGIVEYETYIGKTRYMIVDTGGQRNERRSNFVFILN